MKPSAIVYTSNTGFTKRYAEMFGEKTGLCVYSMEEAKTRLEKGTEIIYFGWLMAGSVAGYKKAAKLYDIKAVCGVCLGTTGSQMENVRKNCKLSDSVPAFTVQGGMDHAKLKGGYGFGIKMLTKFMARKKKRTAGEDAMLELLIKGGDYVCEENLAGIFDWYNKI
ncbi:MAG: hypothetical protein IJM98_02695 [Oscillospiraceae bacterium]|nr:hypothetical protein [Oscillospiraceae bacterium]MBQ6699545.1 hypothetical protein [Oscillospiraceae bacterium]